MFWIWVGGVFKCVLHKSVPVELCPEAMSLVWHPPSWNGQEIIINSRFFLTSYSSKYHEHQQINSKCPVSFSHRGSNLRHEARKVTHVFFSTSQKRHFYRIKVESVIGVKIYAWYLQKISKSQERGDNFILVCIPAPTKCLEENS